MEPNYSWIYLVVFMAIPLARIIPRIISKYRKKENSPQTIQDKQFSPNFENASSKPQKEVTKPQTRDLLVLGELNRGSNSFEKIQKNTGFTSKELEEILDDLEKNGLLKVLHKQGLFGPKVELYPTDKGFKEYYS